MPDKQDAIQNYRKWRYSFIHYNRSYRLNNVRTQLVIEMAYPGIQSKYLYTTEIVYGIIRHESIMFLIKV